YPPLVDCCNLGEIPGCQLRRASGCVTLYTSTNQRSTFSSYAEPERVSSLRLFAGAGDSASHCTRHSMDRITGLCPNGPAMVSMAPMTRGIVPQVDVATGPRSRFRHR